MKKSSRVDWEALRVFLDVVRAKSFNAAAQNGPFNQSTISRRILNLEAQLGIKLFHRSTRGIDATPAASSILDAVVDMERSVALIENKIREERDLTGLVKLRVSDGIGGYWLPPRMKSFYHQHQNINLEIICAQNHHGNVSVDTDIHISWKKPDNNDIVIIAENAMLLKPCASVEYLHNYGVPHSLTDLKNHRICQHLNYPIDGMWAPWSRIVEECPNVCYRTDSSWALGEATKNGIGISLQPISIADREKGIKILDLDEYYTVLNFWLICHKNTKDIPRVRAVISFLRSELFCSNVVGSAFSSVYPHE